MAPTAEIDDPTVPPTSSGHWLYGSTTLLLVFLLTVVGVPLLNRLGDTVGVSDGPTPARSYSYEEEWPVYSVERVAMNPFRIGVSPRSYPPAASAH